MNVLPDTVSFTGAESNTLVADVWRAGPARAVALLMHGGGQTRHSWDGTAARMAANGISAVSVDARGHGDSQWVASKTYSFSAMAADLAVLARQAAVELGSRPVLVGASMGGLAGMLAVADDSDLFDAMVFVDITPRMERSGVDKVLGFMAARAADGFATVEEAADTIAAYLPDRKRPRSLDGLSKNLRLRQDGRWYWHWDPSFVSGPRPITSAVDPSDVVRREEVFLAGLKRAKVPLLLVRGSKSELVSEAAVASFLQAVPHARFTDVSGAGHMVAGDRNDVFAAAVIGFIHELSEAPHAGGAGRQAEAADGLA